MSKYHRASPIQNSSPFSRPHNARMASMRRIKIFTLIILVCVITILFYTSRARSTQTPDLRTPSDFYSKTKSALENGKKAGTAGAKEAAAAVVGTTSENTREGNGKGKGDEESRAMQQRLKEAADSAKEKANAKAPKPDPPSAVIGKGSAAEGSGSERGVNGGRRKHGDEKGQKVVSGEETERKRHHP